LIDHRIDKQINHSTVLLNDDAIVFPFLLL